MSLGKALWRMVSQARDIAQLLLIFFPASAKPAEAVRQEPPQGVSGRGVILLVDDDEYVLQAADATLQSFGYSVLLADDGYKAVEIFRARGSDIDLVVLDMTMPGMGGEETFRALRDLRPDVKVLLSTAYNADEAGRRLITRGFAGFLQKPYVPEQLAAMVQQLLEGSAVSSPAAANDEPALHALRAAYRQKLPDRLAELVAALRTAQAPGGSDKALQDAYRSAHTLKGTVGSYGFDEIAAVLAGIEETLQQRLAGSTSGAEADWARMEEALDRVRTALEGGM